MNTSQIGSAVGSALLNYAGIPGPIGALIINSIFPSGGVPSYFDQVYEEITQIVNQALAENDISQVDDAINGINNWVSDSYLTSKADPKYDRTQLNRDIEGQANQFYNDIAILRDPTRATAGFAVFLLAASTHIALLQECAITDPDHPGQDAWNSRFAAQILVVLKDYIAYAQTTWPTIRTARLACISTDRRDVDGHNMVYIYWTVTDSVTGEHQTFSTADDADAHDHSVAAAADMTQRASDALVQALGDPDTIMSQWTTLQTVPLPLGLSAAITQVKAEHSIGQFMDGPSSVYTITWATTGAQSVIINAGLGGGDEAVAASGKRSYVMGFLQLLPSPFQPLDRSYVIATDPHHRSAGQDLTYVETAWDPSSPLATHAFDPNLFMAKVVQTFDWPAPAG